MTSRRAAVFVLHGLLGTAYGHFGRLIGDWSSRGDVVPIDLPGHGRCRLDAGPDYLNTAYRYLEAVVEKFGPGHLVAASYLGGPLAVRCARQRPDLVESLVLTGFAPGLPREVFLTWLGGFRTLADQNPALAGEYDRLHTGRWRATLLAYGADARAAYEDRILVKPASLGALAAPVLLANGSLKSVERQAAERAPGLGPRVRGVVIEGAGHLAGHDCPDAFGRAVDDFWVRTPAR
jgi:pimeloyl-ACP methyl ester carboxylesterase